MFLDGDGALGESPEPFAGEPLDLPTAVAVHAPVDPEPLGESTAELLLVD
jgi:hypothetical protein